MQGQQNESAMYLLNMNQSLASKIYTPHGVTKTNPFPDKLVVHLGCGKSKLNGALGVDMLDIPGVDVIHDLDFYPWPLKDTSVDIFFVHSVLEHLSSLPDFFEEVWRVGKNGTRVIIAVPYFRSVDAFVDPTHKHFFATHSLDYFLDIPGSSLARYNYTPHKFMKIGFWYGWPRASKNVFVRWFKAYIHQYSHLYDQYLSLIVPVKVLVWELEVLK